MSTQAFTPLFNVPESSDFLRGRSLAAAMWLESRYSFDDFNCLKMENDISTNYHEVDTLLPSGV